MAFIRKAFAKRRPSRLHNAKSPRTVSNGTIKRVTFEDLIEKDLSRESTSTIYTFICEAMDVTDPSPTFLTQVTSELQCPPIDWYDFRLSQQMGIPISAEALQDSNSPFVEVEQDNGTNNEMSGALHLFDNLIAYAIDDSLVCHVEASLLFRRMPMKLVDKNGLRFFDLFHQPETAFAEMPEGFVITVMGIQLAKQLRDEALALTNDEALLDTQMLRGLASYGGTFQYSSDAWNCCPAVCMPEHMQRFHLNTDRPHKTEEYWSYMSSRNNAWVSADNDAAVRSFQREISKASMHQAKRREET